MSDCVLDSSLLYGLILAEAHAMGSVLAPPRLGFASERYGICTHSQIAAISVRSTLNAHGADRCSPLRRPHVTRHAARFSRCREGTVAPHIHSPLPHQYTPGHPPNLDCRTITTSIAPPIHTWPPPKPRLPHHHHIDCPTNTHLATPKTSIAAPSPSPHRLPHHHSLLATPLSGESAHPSSRARAPADGCTRRWWRKDLHSRRCLSC